MFKLRGILISKFLENHKLRKDPYKELNRLINYKKARAGKKEKKKRKSIYW